MKRKILLASILSVCLVLNIGFTSFAGQWVQDEKGWRYQLYDGNFMKTHLFDPKGYYIDSDKDGIAELYYFDRDGYMLANTVGPSFVNLFTGEEEPLYAVDENGRAYNTFTGELEKLAIPQGTINTDTLSNILKPEYVNIIMSSLDVVDATLGTTAEDRRIGFDDLTVYVDSDVYTSVHLIDNKVTSMDGNCQTLFINPTISIEEISRILGIQPEVMKLFPDSPALYEWKVQKNPDVVLTLFNSSKSDAPEQRNVGLYISKTVD